MATSTRRTTTTTTTTMSYTNGSNRPSTVMMILIVLAVIFYVPTWIHLHMNVDLPSSSSSSSSSSGSMEFGIPSLNTFLSNSMRSGGTTYTRRRSSSGGTKTKEKTTTFGESSNGDVAIRLQELQDRVHYLETKLDAYLAYTSDPFLSTRSPTKCKNNKFIKDIACRDKKQCALDNQMICLDDFPNRGGILGMAKNSMMKQTTEKVPCVVYDFGIRESPEYGLAFAQNPFQCDVYGFDPSPISVEWWDKNQNDIQKVHPTYQFKCVGAGGTDGKVELREYDWGQVSILQYPTRVVDVTQCNTAGGCKYKFYNQQKSFVIPVRTLRSLMSEFGHDRVHLLKLDVEGSEYMFLERMIDDLSCRQVDQLTLEWHHYDYDRRYGVTSNPQINVLVALLKDRCGLEQYWVHESKGWPSNQKIFVEMGMNLYYTLTSFKRTKRDF